MSSSNASWSNKNRESTNNYAKPTASSRSRTVSSPHYNNAQTRNTSSSEVSNLIPSYVDILATPSGKDWLEAYEFPTIKREDKISHRRTFSQAIEKQHVSVRKTKSLREPSSSRTKLRSPPPPPPPPQENTSLDLLLAEQRDIKKQPFMNKIKRKLSFSKEKSTIVDISSLPANPRRTVSSSVLNQQQEEQYSNTLAEYQGYSRQSRHRSFTYSPPPPPRTSSLKTSVIPSSIIPPVPPVPKHHVSTALKPRSSSIKKKKSDSSYTSSRSNSRTNHDTQKTISPEYKMNLSQDLAQIEEDIKALEIQRQSFISAQNNNEPKTIGRKRGKVKVGLFVINTCTDILIRHYLVV